MSERSGSYQHYLDASYEAWRRGLGPDSVDMNRAYEDYASGRSPEATVRDIEHRRYEARRQREYEEAEYEEAMRQANDERLAQYEAEQQEQPMPEPPAPEAPKAPKAPKEPKEPTA